MKLANYINDLLYRYECVIVPNFGGFVTNRIHAKLDQVTQVIYPPSKKITFNSHLNINDGLLINYIASAENVSFEEATNMVSDSINEWKNELKNNALHLENIGTLNLNEKNQIIFEPNKKANHLTESFGLSSVKTSSIDNKEVIETLIIPIHKKEENKKIPVFIKYAATAAILLTLGFVGNNIYKNNEQKTQLANQEKALEKKIQAATFVISNPLPTIDLNVVKETKKNFHVVAGAFQFPENAKKKVNQLKRIGYNARILGVNKWGLTEVAYASFSDRNDATNHLYKIQDSVSKDAWLLIKK